MPILLFVSGSSGAGKTTVLREVRKRFDENKVTILHFDSIGIPSNEEMIKEAGSLERWQEIATHSWIERIQKEYPKEASVILEGQSNPDFVTSACARYGLANFRLVLLDCAWEVRAERLHRRNQPELVNSDMENWSNFLRNQAQQKNIRIIDTTHQTVGEVADEFMALL